MSCSSLVAVVLHSYHGFRYVQLEGWPGASAPTADALTALFVHTAMKPTGNVNHNSSVLMGIQRAYVCVETLSYRNVLFSSRYPLLELLVLLSHAALKLCRTAMCSFRQCTLFVKLVLELLVLLLHVMAKMRQGVRISYTRAQVHACVQRAYTSEKLFLNVYLILESKNILQVQPHATDSPKHNPSQVHTAVQRALPSHRLSDP